jgi:NACHT conflict system protein
LLEAVVDKLGDPDALMAIIRSYLARTKPFDGSLRFAIEAVAIGQRPAPGWANAYEEFSVEMPQLRKQLFAMLEIESERALASACLTTIDELRDRHGRTDAEPRHPDIESDRPWPVEAAL